MTIPDVALVSVVLGSMGFTVGSGVGFDVGLDETWRPQSFAGDFVGLLVIGELDGFMLGTRVGVDGAEVGIVGAADGVALGMLDGAGVATVGSAVG